MTEKINFNDGYRKKKLRSGHFDPLPVLTCKMKTKIYFFLRIRQKITESNLKWTKCDLKS